MFDLDNEIRQEGCSSRIESRVLAKKIARILAAKARKELKKRVGNAPASAGE
jgi:hypothetical protein